MPFPGDKFRPSAARERELTKIIEAARGQRASFGVPGLDGLGPGHVIAKNETGAKLEFGKGALIPADTDNGVSNQEALPRRDPSYQKGFYTLKALAPLYTDTNTYFESLAITLEPIEEGKFGRVAIAGLAVVDQYLPHGFVFPLSNTLGYGMYGLAKVVANHQSPGVGTFSIVDLSARAMQARYTMTTNWDALSDSATAQIGTDSLFTTQIFDTYNIATWQVNGDSGIAVYEKGIWKVINPWCVVPEA